MALKTKFKDFFKMTPSKYILVSFAGAILIGAFLLCLPISHASGNWCSFVDALFTSTSSVCVTGLMVFDVAMELSLFGQIVVLLLIQIGGLGFVTITSFLFLLVGKKINYSTRITLQESLNQEHNQGIVKTVHRIFIITFFCELVGFLMLAPSMIEFTGEFWSGLFKALFLSVSAFCNAGFDPLGGATAEFSNLAYFANNSLVLIPVMLLTVIGGIGFIVILDIFDRNKKPKKLMLHTRVVLWMTGILIFAGAGSFMALEWNNPDTIGNFSVWDKIVVSFFQSINVRGSGFFVFEQSSMTSVSIIISQLFMIVGGSPVSLAGGIKTTTLFVILLLLFKNPDKNGNIVYKNKLIKNTLINKAVRIVTIMIGLVVIGTILITIIEGGRFSVDAVIIEIIAAVTTIGMSFGITPFLGTASKIILSLLMYAGRIGMLTIPLAFKAKETVAEIEYAEARITVG